MISTINTAFSRIYIAESSSVTVEVSAAGFKIEAPRLLINERELREFVRCLEAAEYEFNTRINTGKWLDEH